MPMYGFKCLKCLHKSDMYTSVERRNAEYRCGCGGLLERTLDAPMVHADIPAYTSPVTGRWINSRKQRMEDLKRTNSRPWEGMEQEKKEAARRSAYNEAKNDAKLTETIGKVMAQSGIT